VNNMGDGIHKRSGIIAIITSICMLIILTVSWMTKVVIYELNFHTSVSRQKTQILGFIKLNVENKADKKLENFFTLDLAKKLPDRWEQVAIGYRDLHLKDRTLDGSGMVILKIIDKFQHLEGTLTENDLKAFKSLLAQCISMSPNDNNRSKLALELHIIINRQLAGENINLLKSIQKLEATFITGSSK